LGAGFAATAEAVGEPGTVSSVNTMTSAASRSYAVTCSPGSTATPGRLRNDRATTSSSWVATMRTRPAQSSALSAARAAFVRGTSIVQWSMSRTAPERARSDSAQQ